MKKILVTFIALMLLFSVSASAVTVEFIIDNTTMAKVANETADRNLETSTLLAAPFIANNRTMVPIRALSESFSCKVGWDSPTRKVTITNQDKEINLFIDSTKAYVNGQEVTLEVAPQIRGDITFVPVRFVTENMGYNVSYVPEVKSVLIYDKENIKTDNTSAIYPLYDVVNYYIYMLNKDYPSGATLKETSALSLYFAEMKTFAKENNLTISDDYVVGEEELKNCYENNLLKGEYSELMSSFGYEQAFCLYHDRNSQKEILENYKTNYVCAKHVLVEDKSTADKIYKSAKSGKNFDSLIKEYGIDPGMQSNFDGYIFTKGDMVKVFEEATYALKENEISKPVKSEYGYHIIKRLPLPVLPSEKMYEIIQKMFNQPILDKYMK